jgi:hypothetical protein
LGPERVRHLIADVHGQMAPALVPDPATAARLDRRVGLALLMERHLDNDLGLGEAAGGITRRETLP